MANQRAKERKSKESMQLVCLAGTPHRRNSEGLVVVHHVFEILPVIWHGPVAID